MAITFCLALLTWLVLLGAGQVWRLAFGAPFQDRHNHFLEVLMGNVVLMLLANTLSLFGGLNQMAPAVILPFLGWGLYRIWLQRRILLVNLLWFISAMSIFCAALLLKASAPTQNYDYGAYYLPTIKWAGEYGVVPGMAHLLSRLGFNSSWHVLQSLLSYKWLGSWMTDLDCYDLNEITLLAFTGFVLTQARHYGNALATWLLLPALPVLGLVLTPFLGAPAADLAVIIYYWLAVWGTVQVTTAMDEHNMTLVQNRLIWLWLVAATLITIKLSAVPVILLPVGLTLFAIIRYGFSKWLRLNTWSGWHWWMAPMLGAFILLPWLIRTWLITGYPLYPVPNLPAWTTFGADWVIDQETIKIEVNNVVRFAQFGPMNPYLDKAEQPDISLDDWLPTWWSKMLTKTEKIWLAGLVAGLVALTVFSIKNLVVRKATKAEGVTIGLLTITLIANTYLWFSRGPAPRFGYSFILPAIVLPIAWLIREQIREEKLVQYIPAIALSLILAVVSFRDSRGLTQYRILPPTTLSPALGSKQYGDIKVWYPMNYMQDAGWSDTAQSEAEQLRCELCVQCWSAPLPCTAHPYDTWEPRGKTIADGFRAKPTAALRP